MLKNKYYKITDQDGDIEYKSLADMLDILKLAGEFDTFTIEIYYLTKEDYIAICKADY